MTPPTIHCAVCSSKILLHDEGLVFCEKCLTPHHEECWKYNRDTCALFGCGNGTFTTEHLEPDLKPLPEPEADDGSADATMSVKAMWFITIATIVLAALLGGTSVWQLCNSPTELTSVPELTLWFLGTILSAVAFVVGLQKLLSLATGDTRGYFPFTPSV